MPPPASNTPFKQQEYFLVLCSFQAFKSMAAALLQAATLSNLLPKPSLLQLHLCFFSSFLSSVWLFDFYWCQRQTHRFFFFPFASDFCIWFSFLKGIKPDLPQVCTAVKLGYLPRSHCLAGELAHCMSRLGALRGKKLLTRILETWTATSAQPSSWTPKIIMCQFWGTVILWHSSLINEVVWHQPTLPGRRIPESPMKLLKLHQISRSQADGLRQYFWSRFSGSFPRLISPSQMRWSLLHVLKPILKKCLIKHLINAFLPALLLLRRLRKIWWKAHGSPPPRWDGSTSWLIPFLNYKYYELRWILGLFLRNST